MKFKKIGTKMLAFILPVIILALCVLTLISVQTSEGIINAQIRERMKSELSAQEGEMNDTLTSVSTMATMIADMVKSSYQVTSLEQYEKILGEMIVDNDAVLGSGIWFEPYVYDKSQQYVGPYIYKDGSTIATTYDYSNAEYDYFTQEYYTMTKNAKSAKFTDPYYDAVSGTIMSSCSMPILQGDTYLGCVTVDIELSSITAIVDNIKVGENGTGMLITGSGVYLAGVVEDKIQNAVNICEDEISSLATAGKEIVASEQGELSYTADSGKTNLYYETFEKTGWKLIIQMPQSELDEPLKLLMSLLAAVCVIAIIFAIVVVLLQVSSISKSIKKVQVFAKSLAEGDFTVDPIMVKTADELGDMGKSLNEMFGNNKDVISNISEYAIEVETSSNELKGAAEQLTEQFEDIKVSMDKINQAMMTTSAATQQVNASTEEVLSNVNLLANETDQSMSMAQEIRVRATNVGKNSKEAYDSAQRLTLDFEERLNRGIENAKVVSQVGEMAEVISNIAEQINLLSLNASIEAARAGEAGKGFTVVASEIGKLAGNTSEAVNSIQDTIHKVQLAFNELTADSRSLLDFLQQTVTPDYNQFVDVAKQYNEDAEMIAATSQNISEMAENIKVIMSEVTAAIQNIAEATQDTTSVGVEVVDSVNTVDGHVTNVNDMSMQQKEVAENLNVVVGKFKL